MRGGDRGRRLWEGVQGPGPEERRPFRGAEARAGADGRGGHAALYHPRGGGAEAPGDLRAPQRGQVSGGAAPAPSEAERAGEGRGTLEAGGRLGRHGLLPLQSESKFSRPSRKPERATFPRSEQKDESGNGTCAGFPAAVPSALFSPCCP